MTLVRVACLVAFSALILAGCFHNKPKAAPQVVEGQLAPNFVLETFDGRRVNLAFLRDKAVFIDFWAASSADSLKEMPQIEKISNEFKDDLVVWGIHRQNTENAAGGERFAIDRNVTYTLLRDSDGSIYKAFVGDGNFMPVAAFIDKKGVVVKVLYGPKTEAQMRKYVRLAIGDDF